MKKSCKVLEELFSASINTPSPYSKYQPTFNITYETIFASHMSFASIGTRTINIGIIDESYRNRGAIGFQCFVGVINPVLAIAIARISFLTSFSLSVSLIKRFLI